MEVLFSKGRSISSYPLKLVYDETSTPLQYPAQAMFVAPKRSFKRAHDRNALKRRMREVYRLNKNNFYEAVMPGGKHYLLAFIYTGRKQEAYAAIEKALLKLLANMLSAKEK